MVSRTMSNRMKAAAIAALMCLSVAATTIPVMTGSMDVYAVSVGEELAVKDNYKGYTAELAKSGVKNITLTLKADYTGNFSYGFGIGTADDPYWYEWDGKKWVDTKGGTVEVEGVEVAVTKGEEFTIQIDTSTLDLSYNPKSDKYPGTYEFRNYYSGTGGTVTLVSSVANGKAIEPSTDPTDEKPTEEKPTEEKPTEEKPTEEKPTEEKPTEEKPTEGSSVSEKLGLKDVFTGYWADYATSGIKNVAITFEAGFTGTVDFGMGIGVADTPYWYEWDSKTGKWTDTKDGTIEVSGTGAAVEEGKEYVIVFDTSKQTLSYNPKDDKYPGHFEFRNNYVSETGGYITVTGVEVNTKKTSTIEAATTPNPADDHDKSFTDGMNSVNPVTSDKFTYKDGVLTATLARQQEFKTPYTLTRGYDEEYYAKEGVQPTEGVDPMNAHKFAYNSFGLSGVGESVVIESLAATVQSKGAPIKTFMYGGGLNVQNESPADTESAKAKVGMAISEDSGYWYNDMGQDKIEDYQEAGVEFGIEPNYGYFLSSEDNQLGEYFTVIWDVPAKIKPYEQNGDLSFQYWYGVEDTEEYTEVESVDLLGGILTYTQSANIKDPGSKTLEVKETIKEGETSSAISYADMGLQGWNEVKALVFTLDTSADMDKLVYGVGTSVGDDFKMWSPEDENWDYVMLNTSKGEVQIVWFVPTGITPNTEFGNVQFGYWYGAKEGKEVPSVTLKSVDVYYSEGVEPTEPTTDEPFVPMYGDVNIDGEVDILDVIMYNKFLLGAKTTITEEGKINGDVNVDGKYEPDDSLNILKCVVKLIQQTDFPIK